MTSLREAACLRARDDYHARLRDESPGAIHARMDRVVADSGLRAEGPDVARILRPCVLPAEIYESAQRRAAAVVQGLESIYTAARRDPALRRALGVPGWQDPLFDLEPGDPPPIVGRLDGFLEHGSVLRFLEYNPTPGGVYAVHALGRITADLPAHKGFARAHPVRRPDPVDAAERALAAAHAARGRGGLPHLAVFGWSDSTSSGEVEKLAQALRDRGVGVLPVAAESSWEIRGGRLWTGPFDVDLVLFLEPTLLGDFLRAHGLDHPVMRALRQGAEHYFGGLARTLLFLSKRVFAALSDPQFASLVPDDVQRRSAGSVPWTRVVGARRTMYAGSEVDLVALVHTRREHLVLKPPYGYGGADVVFGWQTTAETWRRTIERALDEGWVVLFKPKAVFSTAGWGPPPATDRKPSWTTSRPASADRRY